jgi:hypothetical protein
MMLTPCVEHYRVFSRPTVSAEFISDIKVNGVTNQLRIYTNGRRAVLRDGHHRLVVAQQIGISFLPVHVIPDALRIYAGYSLAAVDSVLEEWLIENDDKFYHRGHRSCRQVLNSRLTRTICDCGAEWRWREKEELVSA